MALHYTFSFGLFSAVSTPQIARVGSFFSIFRNLQSPLSGEEKVRALFFKSHTSVTLHRKSYFGYISYFHSAWIPYTLRRGTASSTTRRPAAAGSSCRSPPRRSVSGASGAPSTGARRDRRARSSFLSSPRRRHDKRTFRIEYNLILMYSTREF